MAVRTIAWAVAGASAVMSSAANAAVINDNFNDGMFDDQWVVDRDVIKVRESAGRLRFKSDTPAAGERTTLYASNDWQFRAERTWSISMDYMIRPDVVTGSQWVAVGMGLHADTGADEIEISAYVRQEAEQLLLVVEIEVNNKIETNIEEPIEADTGTLKVSYDRAANRFRALIDGEAVITINDFIEDRSIPLPTDVAIGAARKGFVPWNYNDVWLDNFTLRGVVIE
jgi:hypothetical protein